MTGYNKQTYICHPFLLKAPLWARDCVSLLRLWAVSIDSVVLHRELVISNSAFDNRCACWRKMSRWSKRPWLLQASKISNWLLTLIVTGTNNFTSFNTYILVTTGMNLIGQTKILTDCGRYETCLKFWLAHFPYFTTILKIWLLTNLLFPSKGGWFSNSTYQRNASVSTSKFQTLWLDWVHLWQESIPWEGQTAHSTARDSNPCDSDRTDKEDRRTWPQIIHGQFLFFPWIIWWLGK